MVPVLAELPETTEVSPASEPLHVPFPPAPIRARMLSAQSSSSRVVARFTSTCAAVLRPEQRVALPGEAAKVSWQGGDATPDVGSHIDWGDRVFIREPLQDGLYQALAALFPDAPALVIIAVAELMMAVCTACVRGHLWRGLVKWFCSDNKNTVGWIRGRYSKVPLVQFLLMILGIAEAIWGFELVATYVRTYHNERCD